MSEFVKDWKMSSKQKGRNSPINGGQNRLDALKFFQLQRKAKYRELERILKRMKMSLKHKVRNPSKK